MKNRKVLKTILGISLSALLVSTSFMGAFSLKADAAVSKKKMNLVSSSNPTGSVTGGGTDHIYFGKNTETTNYFDGCFRVLDSSKTNTGAKGMFLLSEKVLGTPGTTYGDVKFRNAGEGTAYQGSLAQSWCASFYASSFSNEEKQVILATTKNDPSVTVRSIPSKATDNNLNGDRVFFLSSQEAYNSDYGFISDTSRVAQFAGNNSQWWTRSAHASYSSYDIYIKYNGQAYQLSASSSAGAGARPAFNLNSNKVLFTSAATGGKSSGSPGESSLKAVESYSGSDWKLTLNDSLRSGFKLTAYATTGERYFFDYSGAKYGSNEYISAILVSSSGEIKYYGNLVKVDSSSKASGSGQVYLGDKLASGDRLYIFNEQCNGDKKTDYSSELQEIPTLPVNTAPTVSVSNTNAGVSVTWTQNDDAVKYRVLRKEGSGSFTALAKVSGTSYIDASAVNGKTYTYTVRCMDGSGKYIGDYDEKGVSITVSGIITAPSITLKNTTSGINIKWSAVSGVPKYRILRKEGNGSFTALAKISGTSYTDKTAVEGKTYTYTIRCMNDSGSYIGIYDKTGKSITAESPIYVSVSRVVIAPNGVVVKWGAVDGINKYRILRKAEGESSFTAIAKVSDTTTYTDSNVVNGKTYTYIVRCLDSSSAYVGGYDTVGQTLVVSGVITAPVVKVQNGTNVTVSWNSVVGADKYRVLRKEGDGSFKALAKVTGTSYVDKTAEKGKTYTYTVRCMTSDGSYIGSYDKKGVTITH